jgi:hypothetical protein
VVLKTRLPVAPDWETVNVPMCGTPAAPVTESVKGLGDVVTLTAPGLGLVEGVGVGLGVDELVLLQAASAATASAAQNAEAKRKKNSP